VVTLTLPELDAVIPDGGVTATYCGPAAVTVADTPRIDADVAPRHPPLHGR
jgi:hypothetical protein